MNLKNLSMVVFMLVFVAANWPASGAAETVTGKILVIRPEKLPIPQTAARDQLLRNPFQWPAEKTLEETPDGGEHFVVQEVQPENPEIAGLTLNGIFWNDKAPVAIINSKSVTAGEKIMDALIQKISKDEVIVEKDDKLYVLSLKTMLIDLGRKGNK